MRIALKSLGILVGVVVLAVAGLLIGARFSDGPIAIVAGGPFTSGDQVTGLDLDWSFVRELETIEFQLLEPARSRVTWILEHGGKIYIPCGYMDSTWGRIWKKWPIEAEKDGRAIARIQGKLYDRQLVRIKEGPVVGALLKELSRKYVGYEIPMEAVTSETLWLFELAPRSS